jgi:hypothetical protein
VKPEFNAAAQASALLAEHFDVKRPNLDGTGQETIVSGLKNPVGIALQITRLVIPEPAALVQIGICTFGVFVSFWRTGKRGRSI